LFHRFLISFISFSGSFAVHTAVLIVLGVLTYSIAQEDSLEQLEVHQRPEELLSERLEEDTTPARVLATTSGAGNLLAVSADPFRLGAEPQIQRPVDRELAEMTVDLAEFNLRSVPTDRLVKDLGSDAPGEPAAIVDGYGQAMDRITQEILMMLAKGNVLVIWLFDESESMKDDQQEIKERVDRVYAELGLSEAVKEKDALWTVVGSFGKSLHLHTEKPTSDVAAIVAAIDRIPIDASGVENICLAVGTAINQHKKFASQGQRQMAVIVVGDESGDDGQLVEEAIQEARNSRCRVYALGREACFGYPYVQMRWVDRGTGLPFWLQINRGPETAFVEQLQTEGLWRRYDAHPSGFGPYEQVRMARETGGVFFMLPSLETNLVRGEKRIYELEGLRPYLPDLSSRADYAAERRKSPLRESLWEVIATLNPWKVSDMNLRQHFPISAAEFQRTAAEEQQKAKALILAYDAAERRLEELGEERRQEVSARWQANYDLLFAQVVAYKVRAYEYGAALEEFKKSPKPVKEQRTNRWDVATRQATLTGETTASYVSRASALFKQLIYEHPGTPYSARAEWELNRGFGVELVEGFRDPRYDSATFKLPNL
jgi:hypothetical protein